MRICFCVATLKVLLLLKTERLPENKSCQYLILLPLSKKNRRIYYVKTLQIFSTFFFSIISNCWLCVMLNSAKFDTLDLQWVWLFWCPVSNSGNPLASYIPRLFCGTEGFWCETIQLKKTNYFALSCTPGWKDLQKCECLLCFLLLLNPVESNTSISSSIQTT